MDYIQTFSGEHFSPFSPFGKIEIRDIAHSLSLLCRFNGHCRVFYSVAEHSVRVAQTLPPSLKLWGLLHDAAEAYLGDIPRPVKQHLPAFCRFEDALLQQIVTSFDLPWPMPEPVRQADDQLLATEARDLMNAPVNWGLSLDPLPQVITPWPIEQAEERFLQSFTDLTP